jgi:DNA repair exonuclease SbcCD nuclease subunit
MKRILLSSDWHRDWSTYGVRRLPEIVEAGRQIIAEARDGDIFVFEGDLSNPDAGSRVFSVIQSTLEFAMALRTKGVEQYWLTGNHDVIEDGGGGSSLDPLKAIAGIGVHVIDRPMVVIPSAHVAQNLVFLPFTPSVADYSPAEFVRELNFTPEQWAQSFVFAHLTIPGMHPGEETTEMGRGRDVLYPVEGTEQARFRSNGHYHRREDFYPSGSRNPIVIPGSVARLTFSEEPNDPAFLIVEGG